MVLTFGVGAVAIRHRAEEGQQKAQCSVDVVLGKATGYVACGVVDNKWKKNIGFSKRMAGKV
ncbi:MAG: hypothetical protein ACI37N_11160 [Prevotella sp.]